MNFRSRCNIIKSVSNQSEPTRHKIDITISLPVKFADIDDTTGTGTVPCTYLTGTTGTLSTTYVSQTIKYLPVGSD